MKATVELTTTELEVIIDAIEVHIEDVRKATTNQQTHAWRKAYIKMAEALKERLDARHWAMSKT